MLDVITKVITLVMMIVILSVLTFINTNKIFAITFLQHMVPLTKDRLQLTPDRQMDFHLDNKTSGAVQQIVNITGHNVTKYLTYNTDRNSVLVSNSTMSIDYTLQIPDSTDPNTVKMSRFYTFYDVQTVTNNPEDKLKIYCGTSIQDKNVTACVSIPYDEEQSQPLLRVLLLK